jgi:hypothetical protein
MNDKEIKQHWDKASKVGFSYEDPPGSGIFMKIPPIDPPTVIHNSLPLFTDPVVLNIPRVSNSISGRPPFVMYKEILRDAR